MSADALSPERFDHGLDGRRPVVTAIQSPALRVVSDAPAPDLDPRGVGVVIRAEHQCMSLRGVRTPDASTVTSAVHGHLRDDPRARAEFFALATP